MKAHQGVGDIMSKLDNFIKALQVGLTGYVSLIVVLFIFFILVTLFVIFTSRGDDSESTKKQDG